MNCNKIIKKFKKVWKKIYKSVKIKKAKIDYKKYKGSEINMATKTKKVRPQNRINKQKEMEQKRIKRRKSMLITIIIIILLAIIGAYLFMSPTFKIQTITVNGNSQLTREKVLKIADIKIGDNILLKSSKVLEVKLKQNGAIEKAKIKKLYPSRVEIEITERTKRFQIKTSQEKYIYIDEQGYIIGCEAEKLELPTIIGIEVTEHDANSLKRLNEKDLDKMENILQIYQECKKIEIDTQITQIQVEDEYILSLENEGLIINLGDATNLKNRMDYVKALLKQEAGNKGTIYVNGNLNSDFKPYFNAN